MSKCRIHQISPDSTTPETGTLIETSNSLKQRRKTRFFTQQVMNFWNMSLPCLLSCLSWEKQCCLSVNLSQILAIISRETFTAKEGNLPSAEKKMWKAESLRELKKIVTNRYNNISLLFWMQGKEPKNNNNNKP